MKRYQPEYDTHEALGGARAVFYAVKCVAAFYVTAGAVIYIGRMFM